ERRRRAAARAGGRAAHRRPQLSFEGGRGGARRARDDRPAGGAELRPHVRPRVRDGGRLRGVAARRGGGGGAGGRGARRAGRRGLIDRATVERQRQLLEAFGLPTAPLRWPADELIGVMRNDKKASAGRLRFVLPQRIGEVALFDDVPEAEVRRVLEGSDS